MNDEECVICMEEFTKKNVQINCPFCKEDFCRNCVRQYNISIMEQPNCPSCKTKWENTLFKEAVLNSFINKEYKDHRKQILMDHEISKFPSTMPAVTKFVKYEQFNNKKKRIKFKNKCY